MTKLIILFSIFFYLNGLTQEDRFYKYVDLKILNSDNEHISNAQVFVDGTPIPYDSKFKSYFLRDTFRMFFDITVYCDGYDTLKYSKFYLNDGSGYLWLKRPSEKYFYASDDLRKIPYQPHTDKLLVILDSRKYPRDDSLWIRFENEIKQHCLKINHSFIEAPKDPFEQWRFDSYVGLEYRLIIQKDDESNFDNDYCKELGYLRSLEMVYSAGPLIRIDKFNIVTFDNTIHLYRPSNTYKSEEINKIVQQIDKRIYYEESTERIILHSETNEIVPQIMEALKKIDFKCKMNMAVYYMIKID